MKIGFIGLGSMGQKMVLHLLEKGVDVVGYNRTKARYDQLRAQIQKSKFKNQISGKLLLVEDIRGLVDELKPPRIIWLMVAHGKPVDMVIDEIVKAGLTKGDIVIDGGNSFYESSIKRAKYLKEKGIYYLDVGTSGGLEGARHGACLMIGGDISIYNRVRPLFRKLAGDIGTETYFGRSGAGHFVKMVHNGVEYGMLQAIGEGFELIEKSDFDVNLHDVANNWSKGSVVRGWLMDLLRKALGRDRKLKNISGVIGGGSTGEWTLKTAKKKRVKTPVIEASMKARKKSVKKPSFSGKIVAILRNQFGGHEIKIKKQKK